MTDAERERLAMLSEECGEVVQIIGKILRHGYENYNPHDPTMKTNREHLTNEIIDVLAVINLMLAKKDLTSTTEEVLEERLFRKLKYTYHQE